MTITREYELVQRYNRLIAEADLCPSVETTFDICRARLALYFFNTRKYTKEVFDRGEIKLELGEAAL